MITSARKCPKIRADVVIGPYKCTFKRTNKLEFDEKTALSIQTERFGSFFYQFPEKG